MCPADVLPMSTAIHYNPSNCIKADMSIKSYGESELIVRSFNMGRFRVTSVSHDSSIFPRLVFTVGVQLHERDADRDFEPPKGPFEVRDAHGELRLIENSQAVGAIVWKGPRRALRSSNYGHENQVQFACDLDHHRLEMIERRRAGGNLTLWLQIWPIVVAGAESLDAELRPIKLDIPRDDWLQFYAAVGGGHYDVIEVQYSAREAEEFKVALTRLNEARKHMLTGDYNSAVARCRNVLEAFSNESESSFNESFRPLFTVKTDERRGAEYAGVVSKLKQLSAFAHHEFGSPTTYSRAEAQFVIRTTEAVLALLGRLTDPKPTD